MVTAIRGIALIPKKGDLTRPENYSGIRLMQPTAKVYNRLLNLIRLEIM